MLCAQNAAPNDSLHSNRITHNKREHFKRVKDGDIF